METILIIALIIGVLLGAFVLASVLTLMDNFKYYRIVYKQLKYAKLEQYSDQVYSANHEFIWFTTTNDFKLFGCHYLHNSYVTWFCPYSAYWLLKYRRYMKENYSSCVHRKADEVISII